jgi:uncharacterized membrane protein
MDELIEGLKKLKKGALFTLLSQILVVIAIALVLSTVGWLPMGSYRSPEMFYTEVIYKLMGIMIPLVGLFVASAILGLVGFILFFIGTGHLKRSNPRYGIGRLGMVLQVVG